MQERAFHIGVDRKRMPQRDEISEPQRRQAGATAPPAGRERGKVAVGEGEHHEVGRILTEIDGRRGLLKPMALTKDDVHRTPDPEMLLA